MKLENIIFLILVLLGIIVLVWHFVGKSPTIEQALLVFILAVIFKNSVSVKGFSSDLRNLDRKFSALAQDFKELARDFREHIRHK